MKGQHRIINEILIFTIGIAITSFILVSFQNISDGMSRISVQDQLTSVSNLISSGIIKVAGTQATVSLKVPRDVSGMMYKIQLEDNTLTLYTIENPILVSRQIFNIGRPYIIKGEVFSSAEYIDIRSDISGIVIERSGFE